MDSESIKTIVALLIRHALTVYGGTLLLSPDDAQSVSGAAAVLIGVVWSILQKRQSKKVAGN